jgi:hypothetical protein
MRAPVLLFFFLNPFKILKISRPRLLSITLCPLKKPTKKRIAVKAEFPAERIRYPDAHLLPRYTKPWKQGYLSHFNS